MDEKKIQYDVEGFESMTAALMELINQYPAESSEIYFSTLAEDSGKSMFPISGAIIETEETDITGNIEQVCLYPFYIIYRVAGPSESRKAIIKEYLDNLGKWLEKQPVTINGVEYQLDSYPDVTGNRKIISIARQTPAYIDRINDNMSEDWAIYISARYTNNFRR